MLNIRMLFTISIYFLCLTFVSGQNITIGTLTDTADYTIIYPFNQEAEAFRFQILYKREEINEAGIFGPKLLNQIGFYLIELPDNAFSNFNIRLQHTTNTDTWTNHVSDGFKEYLHLDEMTPIAGDWTVLPLDESFYWNGVDNILIDICYSQDGPTNDNGKLLVHNSIFDQRFTGGIAADICDALTGTVSLIKPTTQLQFLDILPSDAGVSQIIQPKYLSGSGLNPLQVEITNYGTDSLTSIQINWQVNGGLVNSQSWVGNLPQYQSEAILLPEIELHDALNTVKIWTSMPNDTIDINVANDELEKIVRVIVDAGIIETQVPFDVCDGVQEVSVSMKNFGTDTLRQVDISWTFQGIPQPSLNWTGILYPDSIERNIYLGEVTLGLGTDFEFEFQTFNPNQYLDQHPDNDTLLFITDTVRMHGNYTIGGQNPDFPTIMAAIDALTTLGVCDSTTFLIRDGVYKELLEISSIPGTSAENNIVFTAEGQDSSLVLIEAAPEWNQYLLNITDASFLTFRHLTFNSTTDPSGIAYMNFGSKHITFDQVSLRTQEFSSIYKIAFYGEYFTLSNSRLQGSFRYGRHIKFLNNIIEGGVIRIQNAKEAQIIGNRLHQVGKNECYFDISGTNVVNFQKNWIKNDGIAFKLTSTVSPSSNLVANNFAIGSFLIDGARDLTLTYNTIIHRGDPGWPHPLSIEDSEDIWIKNNILIQEEPNRHVLRYKNNTLDSLDHNIYFNTDSDFCLYNDDYLSFSEFQNKFRQNDINSQFHNVGFTGSEDFHTFDFKVFQAGISTPFVIDDFDGDPRPAIPGVGADEILVLPQNVRILHLAIDSSNCAGNQDIYAKFLNTGAANLTSFSGQFTVNGIAQPSFNWTGNIATGDTSSMVSLGTIDLPIDVPTEVEAWGALPNGVSIEDIHTLSLSTTPLGIRGVYTVGPNAGDFLSLQEALDSLERRGICSTVYLELEAGSYEESLVINHIPGAIGDSKVIITSANRDSSTVILTTDSDIFIQFNGASNIVLEHLSLISTSSSIGSDLAKIGNGTSNIIIQNCHLENDKGNGIRAVSETNSGNIRIQNNHVNTNRQGIYLTGKFNPHSVNCFINNNYFTGQSQESIEITYYDSIEIRGNVILLDTTIFPDLAMSIAIHDVDARLLIANNYIRGVHTWGIYLSQIHGTNETSMEVINNVLSMRSNRVYNGLYLIESDFVSILHNSVYIKNTNAEEAFGLDMGFACDSSLIQNNIFANFAKGAAASMFPWNDIDYNAYYSASEILLSRGGIDVATLSEWQALYGIDANSIATNPNFISPIDLHITNNVLLNNAGRGGLTTFPDIDGETRDPEMPDIGADEFVHTPEVVDAGLTNIFSEHITCSSPDSIAVLLHNFGSTPLKNVEIIVEQDDLMVDTIWWTGDLPIYASDTVWILFQDFGPKTSIRARVINPNGMTDQATYNDFSETAIIDPGMTGTYSIGGDAPDFVTLSEAIVVLERKGLCGPVILNIRPGIYEEALSIPGLPGLSAEYSLLIQSETLDSSTVMLSSISGTTLSLGSCHDITIQHLSIHNENKAISVGATNDLSIMNCHIVGEVSPPSSVVFHNYTIQNCRIEGKLRITGASTPDGRSRGLKVLNNYISSTQTHKFNNQDSIWIEGNVFYDPTPIHTDDNLLEMIICTQGRVSRNKFIGNNDILLSTNGLYGSNDSYFSIDNNSFSTSNDYSGTLLRLSVDDYVQIAYNSFHSNSTGKAFSHSGSKHHRFINNIIADVMGNGVIYWGEEPSENNVIENNVYHSPNPKCIAIGIDADYTLNDFQATFSSEANSHFLDPQFASNTELIFENPAILGLGQPLPEINYDILLENRNDKTPTPGCYEQLLGSSIFADAGPDRVISCNDQFIELSGVGNAGPSYVYQWTTFTGNVLSGANTLTPKIDAPGEYILNVFEFDTLNNNLARDTVVVSHSLLDVEVSTLDARCDNADGTASVSVNGEVNGLEYMWSTGDTTVSIDGLDQGWYSVTISTIACNTHQNVFIDEELSCKVVIGGYVYDDSKVADCTTDTLSLGVENIMVQLLPTNIYTFTNQNGWYEFVVAPGNYTIKYLSPGPLYELICPKDEINVMLAEPAVLSNNNHFYVDNNPIKDLSITTYSGPARPGFDQKYQLTYCNQGEATMRNAKVHFIHDPALDGSVLSSSADIYDSSTREAIWEVPELGFGECVDLTFELGVPVQASLGHILISQATILPMENDSDPKNNILFWGREVTGSFDPNDKQINSGSNPFGGTITPLDTTLHYQIRFQNTGTDTAFTVVIRDTLNAKLDVTKIQVGTSSHDYKLEFEGNNVLVFNFENIMLPDSITNEPLSHGFVTYSIDVVPDLPISSLIENRAAIYFDYNTPVITNTVVNEIVEPTSSREIHPLYPAFKVQPNPNRGDFSIHFELQNPKKIEIQFFDMLGNYVQTFKNRQLYSPGSHSLKISAEAIPAGIYWLLMKMEKGAIMKKVVIF